MFPAARRARKPHCNIASHANQQRTTDQTLRRDHSIGAKLRPAALLSPRNLR